MTLEKLMVVAAFGAAKRGSTKICSERDITQWQLVLYLNNCIMFIYNCSMKK
jgi:hypothetical protein